MEIMEKMIEIMEIMEITVMGRYCYHLAHYGGSPLIKLCLDWSVQ